MVFIKSAIKPDQCADQAYYFCFFNDDVLAVKNSESESFPLLTKEEAKEFNFQTRKCLVFSWVSRTWRVFRGMC